MKTAECKFLCVECQLCKIVIEKKPGKAYIRMMSVIFGWFLCYSFSFLSYPTLIINIYYLMVSITPGNGSPSTFESPVVPHILIPLICLFSPLCLPLFLHLICCHGQIFIGQTCSFWGWGRQFTIHSSLTPLD